jgi:hypothetical protein
MYVNSDVNVLSFEGNFVTLHLGTVLIVNVYCFLHLQRYKPIIIVPTFSFSFSSYGAAPYHRFDEGEGSWSVAERFIIVIKTKPSSAHLQRSVVTFHFANIVIVHSAFPS